MPRVALAITGFPRMFSETYEPVRRFILDKYDAETFAAIYEPYADREYDRVAWLYARRSYFRNTRDGIMGFIEEFSNLYRPIGGMDCKVFVDELPRLVEASNNIVRSTGRKYAHRGIYSQMETWKKTGELIRASGEQFDVVVKYRTDVLIHEFGADLESISKTNKLYVASDNAMGWSVGAHGEVGGGICELMWICRPEIHEAVVSIFDHVVQYSQEIQSCHAEKLLGHHLKKLGIEVETFPCRLEFPTISFDKII